MVDPSDGSKKGNNEDQASRTRKVSLDPSGNRNGKGNNNGNGSGSSANRNITGESEDFSRTNSHDAMLHMFHHHQQYTPNSMGNGTGMMDFNMQTGNDSFGGMGGVNPPFLSMNDHLHVGPMMGNGGGMGGGDQLMDFPSPSSFMPPFRRHTIGHPPPYARMQPGPLDSTEEQFVGMGMTWDNKNNNINHPMNNNSIINHPVNAAHKPNSTQHQQALLQQLQVAPMQSKRKERAPLATSFPVKLYKILNDRKYADIIAWLPHGRAWRILKPKTFEEEVIPVFFRSDRYTSFMRQVNGWGFKRITEGPDLNAYYHEMFLRGLPKVAAKMRRPQKGENTAAKDLGQHPDFYKINMFAPLPPAHQEDADKTSSPTAMRKIQDTKDSPATPTLAVAGLPVASQKKEAEDKDKNGGVSLPHSPSSIRSEVNKMYFTGIHSPGHLPMPAFATSEKAQLASPGSAGAHQFVDLSASPGESINSWHEPRDQDLSNSPSTKQSLMNSHHHHVNEYGTTASSFYQVTPPGAQRLTPPRVCGSMPAGQDDDGKGLSVADLQYLTRQNQILMSSQEQPGPK